MFKRDVRCSQSWAKSIQSITPNPIYLSCILLLPPPPASWYSQWSLSLKISNQYPLCILNFPFMLHTLPVTLDYTITIILKDLKFLSRPHALVQIFSSAPCSHTSSICSFLNVRDQYVTSILNHRQNYSFIYIPIVKFLDRRQDKRLWTEW
jgi:hypothetical protein